MAPCVVLGATTQATSTPLQIPASCDLVNHRVFIGVATSSSDVISGGTLSIQGTVKNLNPYPVPGAELVARIVKLPKKLGSAYDIATDIVARVLVARDLYLEPDSAQPFTLAWKVPANLPSGSYIVDFFVNSNGTVVGGNEYLGISAGSRPVRIIGSQREAAFLDQFSVSVAGNRAYESGSTNITGTSTALVSVTALSTHKAPLDTTIVWKIYSSTLPDQAALVSSHTEQVHLVQGKKQALSFLATGLLHAGYLVTAELSDGTKLSRSSVRIYRLDRAEPTVRSFQLSAFPLGVGQKATIFGCVADNRFGLLATSTVKVRLADSSGAELYSGAFIKGTEKPLLEFVGTLSLEKAPQAPLTLTLEAFDASGAKILSDAVLYSCDKARCAEASGDRWMQIYIPIGALALLGLVIWVEKRKKASGSNLPIR